MEPKKYVRYKILKQYLMPKKMEQVPVRKLKNLYDLSFDGMVWY